MTGADAYLTPEARARVDIDRMLRATGWEVKNRSEINLYDRTGGSLILHQDERQAG